MTDYRRTRLSSILTLLLCLPLAVLLLPVAVAQPILPHSLDDHLDLQRRIDQLEQRLDLIEPEFEKRHTPHSLLADVRIERDTIAGEWAKDTKLISPASGLGVLSLPTDVPEMYDLKLKVKRISGDNTFAVRLVAQGRSFLACIDAHDGQAWCGLELLDGQWVHQNEATAAGGVLTTGMTHTLVFSVRDRGVTVTADEKPVVRWRGNFNRLSTNTGVPGDKDRLSILTYSSFAISQIKITPISFEQPLAEEP